GGVLRGPAGGALLPTSRPAVTGLGWRRGAARAALEHEAAHIVTMPDGTLQVRDGRRHLLYLSQGSAGAALVAQAYTALHEDPALSALIPGVRRGCAMEFVREPGLFTGRTGLAATSGQLGPGPARTGPGVLASVRNLAWHLVADGDGLLVPGAGLRRFSADLGTGAAGVLLGLHFLSGGPGGTGEGGAPRGGAGQAPAGLLELLTLG
ncbi:serine/threonine protein kinase, partial [Streptomyces sp. NPDC005899]